MLLKVLVWAFTIGVSLVSIYQLGLTPAVNSFENKQEKAAKKYVASAYPALTGADLTDAVERRKLYLLDSLKAKPVYPLFNHSYQYCKENGLKLGLDLQGGMNATMMVNLEGVLRSFSKDPGNAMLKAALDKTTQDKITSEVNYITLFGRNFKAQNPGIALNTLFAGTGKTIQDVKNNGATKKIDATDTDELVLEKLKIVGDNSVKNTYDQLTRRINNSGGDIQANFNLDEEKGIINVELPGIKDPKKIREELTKTANLQFWELYTIGEIQNNLKAAGEKIKTFSTSQYKDSSDVNLFFEFLVPNQPYTDKENHEIMPSSLGYMQILDTPKFNAMINNPLVKESFPSDAKFVYGKLNDEFITKNKTQLIEVYVLKTRNSAEAPIEGDKITDTRAISDPETGKPLVEMSMNNEGSKLWAELTGNNIYRGVAIVLDDIVFSAPTVQGKIDSRVSSITMGGADKNKSLNEAKDLSNLLNGGRVAAPAKIVADQLVGASLGQDAMSKGVKAFGIAFLVIFALMLVYYNTSGMIANLALILNLLFTVGLLTILKFTLTAAGIAGLVLTIGMAVDTNVIIFERIKEELTNGKSYADAVREGYKRSLPPVLDAHFTTFLTAAILAYFGLGPVLGFAKTQMLGIVLSLFCGIVFARYLTDLFTQKGKHLEYFTGISKRVFKHTAFKFIEYRKVAYMISIVVFALGVAAYFHGFDQGVEFKGGRSYTVALPKAVDLKTTRESLGKVFNEEPIVKTVGGSSKEINITTSYKIGENNADSAVQTALYNGLKPYLGDMSYENFSKPNVVKGVTTVQPTISKDLKAGAIKATFFSLFFIFLYIFIRFKDWRYSLGTIFALLHDVFIALAVFSFARHIVPFRLELDQHFIAAVLTVIGFSMNDTVIVFDRIREYSKKMIGASKETIINKAINDTLSRTIMTSLTVFITILILFLFGGEVTKGFAFAMLVGVITGTYSSIFVAAPILVDFAKDKPLGEAEIFSN